VLVRPIGALAFEGGGRVQNFKGECSGVKAMSSGGWAQGELMSALVASSPLLTVQPSPGNGQKSVPILKWKDVKPCVGFPRNGKAKSFPISRWRPMRGLTFGSGTKFPWPEFG